MHWSARYIGRPYVEGEFDCAELARLVQREVFKREVRIPGTRAYVEKQSAAARFAAIREQIAAEAPSCVKRTETPQEGDAVLLVARGYAQHIGIYCQVNGEPQVLHAADNSRQVVLTRLRELAVRGLRVEGYYRWI